MSGNGLAADDKAAQDHHHQLPQAEVARVVKHQVVPTDHDKLTACAQQEKDGVLICESVLILEQCPQCQSVLAHVRNCLIIEKIVAWS